MKRAVRFSASSRCHFSRDANGKSYKREHVYRSTFCGKPVCAMLQRDEDRTEEPHLKGLRKRNMSYIIVSEIISGPRFRQSAKMQISMVPRKIDTLFLMYVYQVKHIIFPCWTILYRL